MVRKNIGIKVLILPISAGFLLLFTILYIKPAYDSMAATKKSIQTSKLELSDLQSKNNKLAQMKSKWETMEEKKLIQVALPETNDIENYLSELYGRVSRSGMLLGSFGTQTKSTNAAMGYLCQGSTSVASLPSSSSATVSESTREDALSSPGICASPVGITITVTGSWEQLLSLLKYLQDTNRVANIGGVSIGLENKNSQDQASEDLLKANISLNIFYKQRSESANSSAISSLAVDGQFNEKSLKKIRGIVFSVYEEPVVSETGERNIFK